MLPVMFAKISNTARLVRIGAFVLSIAHCLPAFAQDAEVANSDAAAKSIVEKAEQVRFPREGFEVSVVINTMTAVGAIESREYRAVSKGNDINIVRLTEPASDRGH